MTSKTRPGRHRHPGQIGQAAPRRGGIDAAQTVGSEAAHHPDDELEHKGGDRIARVAGQYVGQGQADGPRQPAGHTVQQQSRQGGEGVAQMEGGPPIKGHAEKQVGDKAQRSHDAGQGQLMGGKGALVQHADKQDADDHDGQQQPHGGG